MRITTELDIDESEFVWKTATSQGPGGQHVNRSETRVILRWNIEHSPSLDEDQRLLLLEKLASRITRDGTLQISVQDHRSQSRNREEALLRFVELIQQGLHQDPPRKKTRPTHASKVKRVDEKRSRSKTKEMRKKPARED